MNYVKNEYCQLSEKEKAIFDMLDVLIDDIGEAGTDTSSFPREAELVLIKYAKKITNEL